MKKLLIPIIAVILFLIPHQAHADITSGLQVWWKFDEGSGTNATDSSGNGFNGTLENGVGWVTGKIGPFATSYANLGEGGDNIQVQNASVAFSGDWTISFWYKGISTGAVDYAATIDGGSTGLFVGGGVVSDQWGFYDGTTVEEVGAITNNIWTFITVAKLGTTYTFYQNGTSVGSFTLNSINVSSLFAGTRGGTLGINGNLDDFRLYNRALSAGDVSQLFAYTGINSNSTFSIFKGELFSVFKGGFFSIF